MVALMNVKEILMNVVKIRHPPIFASQYSMMRFISIFVEGFNHLDNLENIQKMNITKVISY